MLQASELGVEIIWQLSYTKADILAWHIQHVWPKRSRTEGAAARPFLWPVCPLRARHDILKLNCIIAA